MRRLGSILPTGPVSRPRLTFRPRGGNDVFIIANGNPQRVDRIQVRSANGDAEPGRENPLPASDGDRRNELPLVGGLEQQGADNANGITRQQHGRGQPNPTISQSDNDDQSQEQNGIGNVNGQPQQGDAGRLPNQNQRGNGRPPSGRRPKLRKRKPPPKIELQGIPTYLKTHFDMMYYCGMSPINGSGERGSVLQLILFSIVASIGLLFATLRCKVYIIDHAKVGDLEYYITAWYYISSVVFQLGFLWLVVFRHSKVSEILQDATTEIPGIQYKTSQQNVSKLSSLIIGLDIIGALIVSVRLRFLIEGFTSSEVILGQSHETGTWLFLWSQKTNGSDTYDVLFEQYGADMTSTTLSMGVVGMFVTFIGLMQEFAIKDTLLMTALHTYRLSKIFQYNMIKTSNDNTAGDQLTSQLQDIHEQLSNMTDEIESSFGSFFKLVHADNLLYCAYFLAFLLGGNVDIMYIYQGVMNLLKISCILYFPTMAIETSQAVKGVIRRKYCSDHCRGSNIDFKNVILLLQNLEECPITMGRGNFLVDETFALKFIGAVVTSFLFLMESDKEKMQAKRR